MAIRIVSFSFSWCSTGGPGAQLSAECWLSLPHLVTNGSPKLLGARGPLRPGVVFPTTSYQQLLWSPTHQGPQLIRGSKGPSAGLSLPHLISNFSEPQLSDFLSSQSYIIDQRLLNHPLNPWNGMFDRHQAEITVMQFTGHSLPVHHSVVAQWDLHLVPYCQPSSPARFLSINGHWNVSLLLSLEWHVCPGRRSKYKLTSRFLA